MSIICVFGDSESYGAWDLKEGGWVNKLRKYTDSKGPNNIIYNVSISGNTTEDLLRRFAGECKERAMEAKEYKEQFVLIFSIGVNDSFIVHGKPNVPINKFKSNISKLIKKAQDFTDKIYFLELLPIDESKTNPIKWNKKISYTNSAISEYSDALVRKCEEYGIEFIPICAKFKDKNYKKLLYDGLHPNHDGHEVIYSSVKEFLVNEKVIK